MTIEEYRLADGHYLRCGGAEAGEAFESGLFPELSLNLAERPGRRQRGDASDSKE